MNEESIQQNNMPKVRKSFYTVFVKRMLDIILSLLAIIVLSPLLIILCILELIFHGSPVLYAQKRIGRFGKEISIYKFRSMNNNTDADGQLLPGEERITKFGKVIRRFSLDELPELFNILTGSMSIIGPRPLLTKYLPFYTKRHMMRHEVRPGLACTPIRPVKTWTWNDQFENDIWYIENCSFLNDIRITAAVAKAAIVGAEYRSADTREEFDGTNLYSDAKGSLSKSKQ